ncbi:uncharacterized protein EDB93DRAFT_1093202 [Suillus bovinus]|uniref:uncharacterized protein n=1 Tax=Suillus bovinus TaxID=48563 RepID=UPI001B88241B|nr:uncharacterized protein EDB93DRAFT_1093202 [Suillus bovinus]KAG2133624.1 hypothetical protein EDB93DRAFT_1093202 [Suillus bovinus]
MFGQSGSRFRPLLNQNWTIVRPKQTWCPSLGTNNAPVYNIIHIDSIYRMAHLIPVYGRRFLYHNINLHNLYDSFRTFYVNKYADHHAFELAS